MTPSKIPTTMPCPSLSHHFGRTGDSDGPKRSNNCTTSEKLCNFFYGDDIDVIVLLEVQML